MKVFLDFDDVLFNTKKFVVDYKKIFRLHGISEDVYKKYYYDYLPNKKNSKLKKYISEPHIDKIGKEEGIDVSALKQDIEVFLGTASKYVFSDVYDFLGSFKKNDSYLISYSKNKFLESKIKNSGVAKYFKKVVMTDSLKSLPVRDIMREDNIKKDEQVFFLDDRIEQIDDVKKHYKWIKTVFINRKEGRYQNIADDMCDFECKNLKQAKKIILKNS
ncbi:MAG: HAD hydrolase-like protein [Candidatus Moranbacteria bacterium]|nr:HAD hydrolase-like protein [Candidatus Moranbacteria bacterium]